MSASDPWPRIPGYELLRAIGAGGMGSVHLAKREGRAGVCAVKVLKPELMTSPAVVRRFEKEIEVLMLQRHPGIVRLLDAGRTWDGRLYLSTGFLAGHDLFRVIHRVGPLPPPSWLQVALQFLDALAGAHELTREDGGDLRLIHRDIKPENLMVGYDGRLTILDFGLASVRLDDERSRLTRVGQVMGTPKYMAPEQIMDPETVSTATDVFSAAVTLCVSAAGRTTGDDLPNGDDKLPLGELWARLSNPRWPALSQLAPQMPPDFDPVFRKALAVDAAERYPSARSFADALRAAAPFPAASAERLGLLMKAHFAREQLELESWLAEHDAPAPVAETTQPAARRPQVRFADEPGTAVTELASSRSEPSVQPRRRPWALAFAAALLLVAGAVGVWGRRPPPGEGANAETTVARPRPQVRPLPNATPRDPSPQGEMPAPGANGGGPSTAAKDVAPPPSEPPPTPRPGRQRRRSASEARPSTSARPPLLEGSAAAPEASAPLEDARRKDVLGAWHRFDALQAQDMDPQLKTVKALEILRSVAPLDPDDPCGRRALYASTIEAYARRCRPN